MDPSIPPKVLTESELLLAVEGHRQAGQTVVTTNGCFDILHVGHLRYLQAAKAQGDVLIVLVNSDSSVRGLKGPQRPIVPEGERAEMLSGLNCVDYVALFTEPTPEKLLAAIRPDIHVKGGDYSAQSLPEAPLLESMQTRLVFIPPIAGASTTNIIERIANTLQQCNR